ncbi:MAG: hypothetical protein ACRD4E_12070 [Bryobacteraceae bacterium]
MPRLGAALFLAAMVLLPRAALPDSSAVFSMDFAGFPGGTVLNWLRSKGFEPKQDATNASKVVFFQQGDDLTLETRSRAFGLLLNEADVTGYSKIRIEWGVDVYPPGASYQNGVRAEAVMVYVFFGKEKISSGSLFIPDSPYFIGLFLCQGDTIGEPFTGRYFRAGGRFICVAHPPAGKMITTEYPIADVFKRTFGRNETPDISGFGISIDTNNARGNAIARGFVRKIEFVK